LAKLDNGNGYPTQDPPGRPVPRSLRVRKDPYHRRGPELEGEFGSVKVSAVSGSVEVGHALGDVDIRSVSGNLSVERADGECSLNSKSGRITVGRVGRLAKAATISGKVDLTTDGAADVEVKTISGHVSLKVPPGKAPRIKFRSLAGKLRCDCEQGDDFEVRAASVSGSVDITPA
jgi:DUF4097 and DUF4098 domain-containing protein YvlB